MKNINIIKIAVGLAVIMTVTACGANKEEDKTVNEESGKNIVVIDNENKEDDMPSIAVEKVLKYEGMEITDWLDEQTVILSKENLELEKMSLLENAEFYPRSIYLYDLDAKEFKTLKTQKNMFLGGAMLSPDKKHVLYYEYSIGDPAYYLMNIDEDGDLPVRDNVISSALSAKWANDNNVIGVSYAGGAYMADTDRNITSIHGIEGQLFNVQKTEDKIYYITLDDVLQLHMMDLKTNEKKKLNFENADGVIPSPDGEQILITQGTENMTKLIVADAEGNILKTIAEGIEITGVSWSPDQMMIAYQLKSTINGIDNSGIYLYDVLTDKSIQIAVNIGAAKISWSPSGKTLAVTEIDERTYNSSIIYLK